MGPDRAGQARLQPEEERRAFLTACMSDAAPSAVPAMLDVTAAASRIYSDFYLPFEAYLAAAAIYLLATFCLIGVFKLAERHFLAHLAPRKN